MRVVFRRRRFRGSFCRHVRCGAERQAVGVLVFDGIGKAHDTETAKAVEFA
ncbi:hypothetical protein D3C87_2060530 [compost metagenome]